MIKDYPDRMNAEQARAFGEDVLQEWFFSVVDTVEVLTDSKDPKDYLKKMRKREHELDVYMGTNCPLFGCKQQMASTTRLK